MFETMKSALILSLTITSIVSSSALANDNIDASADETKTDTRPGMAPDIREDETKLKLQKGNFVVVPISGSHCLRRRSCPSIQASVGEAF